MSLPQPSARGTSHYMSARPSLADSLGRVGVWRAGSLISQTLPPDVERLGYGTLWIGGSPAADLSVPEQALDSTDRLCVATGVVNIWRSPAAQVSASFHRLENAYPGRFFLGIGIGHREMAGDAYQRPYDALVSYLDVLDREGVPAGRRVIAALGPRTLALAAARAAGTHPYLTTPAHTRFARQHVGSGVLIAPEQRLRVGDDVAASRAKAREFLARYLRLSNYRRTLESHGFTADELDGGGTDGAVDALVPHGVNAGADEVGGHLSAGADHVTVQILPANENPVPHLERLAQRLELPAVRGP